MSSKTPTYRELYRLITGRLGFKLKNHSGSHQNYVGIYNGRTRLVTLDANHDKLPGTTQKKNVSSMLRQIGMSKKEFVALIDDL